MPEKKTIKRARKDKRQGKSPSTQAGEFVREEMEHIREGKHGASSPKQAIAIGLSKARRAGVKLQPKKGASPETRKHAQRDIARGRKPKRDVSGARSRAVLAALRRESRAAASAPALSKQATAAARKRSVVERSRAARKAARTKEKARLHHPVHTPAMEHHYSL
jgi:hypothetical protein